jgi:hypothetical protein
MSYWLCDVEQNAQVFALIVRIHHAIGKNGVQSVVNDASQLGV